MREKWVNIYLEKSKNISFIKMLFKLENEGQTRARIIFVAKFLL